MKTLSLENKFTRNVLIVAAIAILLFLLARSMSINFNQYEKYRESIFHLEEQESVFNQDILKARYELFSSYDSLVHNLNTQTNLQQQLQNIPSFVTKNRRAEINEILTERQTQLEQKIEFTERFKTQNALLKNSLRYLPRLARDLSAQAERQENLTELRITFNDMLRRILLYNIGNNQNLVPQIKERIDELSQLREENGITTQEFPVNLAISHANIVLNEKPQIDNLTNQLLLPLNKYSKNLENIYDRSYQQAIAKVNNYRLAAFGWFLALLVIVNYLVIKRLTQTQSQNTTYKSHLGKIQSATSCLAQDTFNSEILAETCQRRDEWGDLAREFQHMAREMQTRQEKLQGEVTDLSKIKENIEKEKEIIATEECFSFLSANLILLIKDKQTFNHKDILAKLEPIIKQSLQDFDCQLLGLKQELDRVKILFSYAPKVQISQLVAHLKQQSNCSIKEEFPDLFANQSDKLEIWHQTYLISSTTDVSQDNYDGNSTQENDSSGKSFNTLARVRHYRRFRGL